IPLAFDFLVVDPENVGRDNVDTAGIHFQKLFPPPAGRIARGVEFSHHRSPRLAIETKTAAVGGDGLAIGPRRCAHREAGSLGRLRWGKFNGEWCGGEKAGRKKKQSEAGEITHGAGKYGR